MAVTDGSWVCLMYHDVTGDADGARGRRTWFSVPDAEFRRQLDQLRGAGVEGRTLRDALSGRPGRFVGITFDDGNSGQYERGFRALAERGMAATFFVVTDRVGTPGYASWDQLREMRAAGMDVQSHSRSHPFLSELDERELAAELQGAKDALDARLTQDTDTLALPGGDWPRRGLRPLIAASGYRVVATSRWGVNPPGGDNAHGVRVVHRCTISGVPGHEAFGRIVAGDRGLARQRNVRESLLGTLRGALGPTRYAAWRRAFLDVVWGSR